MFNCLLYQVIVIVGCDVKTYSKIFLFRKCTSLREISYALFFCLSGRCFFLSLLLPLQVFCLIIISSLGNGSLEQRTIARSKVLHILGKYSESKTVSTAVLEMYVWSLSQFCGIEDGQLVLEKLISLGYKVLRNQEPSTIMSCGIRNLLISIIQSAGHIAEKYGTAIYSLEEFLQETKKSHLADAYLRYTCMELLAALPHITAIHQVLQQPIQTEKKLDFTLSFLDRYVCESLAANALPYQPKLLHIAIPVLEITTLPSNSTTVPLATAIMSSPCPSPISSGTGSIVDFPRSESFGSEDSRSWSLRR